MLISEYDDGEYTAFAKSRLGGWSPNHNTINGAPVRIRASGPDYDNNAAAGWEEILTFEGIAPGTTATIEISISLTGSYVEGSRVTCSPFNISGPGDFGSYVDLLNLDKDYAGDGQASPTDPLSPFSRRLDNVSCPVCMQSSSGDWTTTDAAVFEGELTVAGNNPLVQLSRSLSGTGAFDISNTALMTITLPEGVTFTSSSGTFMQNWDRFDDVTPSHWAFDLVEALAESGVTAACGNDNCCPDNSVTQAQMAVFLVRAFGL